MVCTYLLEKTNILKTPNTKNQLVLSVKQYNDKTHQMTSINIKEFLNMVTRNFTNSKI